MARLLTVFYASIISGNPSLTSDKRLNTAVIDGSVGKLKDPVIINAPTSFLMSLIPNQTNDKAVGAQFISESGGASIFLSNFSTSINSHFTAAAAFDKDFLTNIINLNMFLLDKPNVARLFEDSMNRTLVSPVIIANPRLRDNNTSITIQLYFTNQDTNLTNAADGEFLCVYYDPKTSSWEDKNCSKPTLNSNFDRYECNCTHLTSFGLIWFPRGDPNFRPIDYASLIFQFVSIVCFLILIIHSIVTRIKTSGVKFQPTHLLPLISCGSTALLFIFYIALVLTVYKKPQSFQTNTCFTSATILMFVVYFLLFFMFGTKTSISYFNYIHFVRLFPPPSFKKLGILLIISCIISIIAVGIAAGLNSNSSFVITRMYGKKICWFDTKVLWYFMTIPIGIFLLINLLVFILIVKCMINHARNATSPHQSYQRIKQCALLLIVSSIGQGIGWISGPFLSLGGSLSVGGDVAEWIFVIFNGLEGLWSILLYIIIRKEHMDEEKRVIAARDLKKIRHLKIKKDKQMNTDNYQIRDNLKRRKCQITFRAPRKDLYYLNDYSYKVELDLSISEYDA